MNVLTIPVGISFTLENRDNDSSQMRIAMASEKQCTLTSHVLILRM